MPRPSEHTAEELALLSPEELAGLQDETLIDEGELDDEELPGAESDRIVADLKATEPVEEKLDPPAVDPALEDEPAAPAVVEPPAVVDPAAAPAEVVEFKVEDVEPLPETKDYDTQITTLKGQMAALAQKHDDGELSTVEYEAQRSQVDDQLHEARMARHDQVKRTEVAETDYLSETVPTFLKDNAAIYERSKGAFIELDARTRILQDQAIKAGRNPFSPKILEAAHKQVLQVFPELAPRTAAPTPAPTPKPSKAARELPPALHQVPAADIADDLNDGGRYAYLDRLAEKNPLEYEQALAKMSDADRDRYLEQ